jgi:hypothetical protein
MGEGEEDDGGDVDAVAALVGLGAGVVSLVASELLECRSVVSARYKRKEGEVCGGRISGLGNRLHTRWVKECLKSRCIPHFWITRTGNKHQDDV